MKRPWKKRHFIVLAISSLLIYLDPLRSILMHPESAVERQYPTVPNFSFAHNQTLFGKNLFPSFLNDRYE